MTIQVAPDSESKYPPRRGDRLNEKPSAKNAQGLFPPDACIFVGNLSTKVPAETLAEDLKSVFAHFGPCHVKIKQDKKKGLPGAFVQFEDVEAATAALTWDECTVLHERLLRIERAKGRRTAWLGLRSHQSITHQEAMTVLDGRGAVEVWCMDCRPTAYQTWTTVCKVTFAYVDDCRDAIKHFQKDEKYYLQLLDVDGSPLRSDMGTFSPHPKPAGLSSSHRNGGSQSRYNNYRPRNGPSNYHADQSGFSKLHHPPLHQENLPPPGGYISSPPILVNGIPYENHSFYPPPPPMPNGFTGPPFMMNGHPGYLGPPQPLPETFMPNISMPGAPFLVTSQLPYAGSTPSFFSGPFAPDNGYFSQPYYGELYTAPMTHLCPPVIPPRRKSSHTVKAECVDEKNGPDEREKEKPADDPEPIIVAGVVMNPKTPEKAPRLLRVYEVDSDTEEETPKTGRTGAPRKTTGLNSLHEGAVDGSAATDITTQSICGSPTGNRPPLIIDSNPQQKPDDTDGNGSEFYDEDPPQPPSPSSTSSTCTSQTVRPSVSSKCEARTRPTVEERVRHEAEKSSEEFTEESLQDVIKSLEAEQMEKYLLEIENSELPSDGESGTAAITRRCSAMSI